MEPGKSCEKLKPYPVLEIMGVDVKLWGTVCRFLLLAIGGLLVFQPAWGGAAESDKRIAFSKRLGIEVLARGSQGKNSWCKETVNLHVIAQQKEFFTSGVLTRLAPKLGAIVAKECPLAISADFRGNILGSDDLVFQGAMQKNKQWNLESFPLPTRLAIQNAPPSPPPLPNSNQIQTSVNIGGVWKGHYFCGRGKTILNLTIKPEDGNRVSGVFAFFLKDGRYGRFSFLGQYDPNSMVVAAKPGSWLTRIPGFTPVPFKARLSRDGKNLSGQILHRGCSQLVAVRKSNSVTPPVTETAQVTQAPQSSGNPASARSGTQTSSTLRSIKSLSSNKEICGEIVRWTNRIKGEYGDKSLNKLGYFKNRDAAKLYQDGDFVSLFGKSVDQFEVVDFSKLGKYITKTCSLMSVGFQLNSGVKPITFHLARQDIMKFNIVEVRKSREQIQWLENKISAIDSLPESSAGLSKLDELEREGKENLNALWPSDRKPFKLVVSQARNRILPVAMAEKYDNLSANAIDSDSIVGLQNALKKNDPHLRLLSRAQQKKERAKLTVRINQFVEAEMAIQRKQIASLRTGNRSLREGNAWEQKFRKKYWPIKHPAIIETLHQYDIVRDILRSTPKTIAENKAAKTKAISDAKVKKVRDLSDGKAERTRLLSEFRPDRNVPLSCLAPPRAETRVASRKVPSKRRIVNLIEKTHDLKRKGYFPTGEEDAYEPGKFANNEEEFVKSCKIKCRSEIGANHLNGRPREAMCELYCLCTTTELVANLNSMEILTGLIALNLGSLSKNWRMEQSMRHGRIHCTSAVFFDSDERPGVANRKRRAETAKKVENEMVTSPLTDGIRAIYNLNEDEIGLAVIKVTPGSLAAAKGIKEGDVIRRINEQKVDDRYSPFNRMKYVLQDREAVHLEMGGIGGRRCFDLILKEGFFNCAPPVLASRNSCGLSTKNNGRLTRKDIFLLCNDSVNDREFCGCFAGKMERSPLTEREKRSVASLRREDIQPIRKKYGRIFFERCQK